MVQECLLWVLGPSCSICVLNDNGSFVSRVFSSGWVIIRVTLVLCVWNVVQLLPFDVAPFPAVPGASRNPIFEYTYCVASLFKLWCGLKPTTGIVGSGSIWVGLRKRSLWDVVWNWVSLCSYKGVCCCICVYWTCLCMLKQCVKESTPFFLDLVAALYKSWGFQGQPPSFSPHQSLNKLATQ